MTGHMGVPRTVPPVPCGIMGREGHVGQSHVGWDDGSPMWDDGTGPRDHLGPLWDQGSPRWYMGL